VCNGCVFVRGCGGFDLFSVSASLGASDSNNFFSRGRGWWLFALVSGGFWGVFGGVLAQMLSNGRCVFEQWCDFLNFFWVGGCGRGSGSSGHIFFSENFVFLVFSRRFFADAQN
jgi:hypothetical protein